MNTYSYEHILICSYVHIKQTCVLRTHVCTKIFQISVALCGATVYYVVKQGARGATYRLGNEVLQMFIYSGSHVKETFASAFKSLVNSLAKQNEFVSFKLNVQNDEGASMSCHYSYAYEHLTFIDELNAEISAHGVAIVVATDYRPDTIETTIFVVCDDD